MLVGILVELFRRDGSLYKYVPAGFLEVGRHIRYYKQLTLQIWRHIYKYG